MKAPQPIRSRIAALGAAFPKQVVTNVDLEKVIDTSDAWIFERTGIKERRKIEEHLQNSDIGAAAAVDALKKGKISSEEIDIIIACTLTPDRWMPSLASVIQVKIGARPGIAAYDLSSACSGWITGMQVADALVRAGQYRNVLVVGSEALSRITNWKDRTTCVLFGDGAGASIVTPTNGDLGEIISVRVKNDGRYGDLLTIPAGGSQTPVSKHAADNDLGYIHMNGRDIFKHAVRSMSSVCEEVIADSEIDLDGVDWFIPHQANIRIIEAVAKKLNFPMSRVALNLEKYGNTSTASIPTCFDEYVQSGKIKKNDLVLMATFGGGLSWGGALVRW